MILQGNLFADHPDKLSVSSFSLIKITAGRYGFYHFWKRRHASARYCESVNAFYGPSTAFFGNTIVLSLTTQRLAKMKFLCLHGAYGNIPVRTVLRSALQCRILTTSQTFRVQLGPMIELLKSDGSTSFEFIQGRVPVTPPPGTYIQQLPSTGYRLKV